MKINMLLSGCLLGLLCFTACDSEGNEMNDYTHYAVSYTHLYPSLLMEVSVTTSHC